MYKVDNGKVITKIAKSTYSSNKKRNYITIVAIIITTFLITSVLDIGVSYFKTISERQIRMEGMDYDISLSEPREDQVSIIKKIDNVKYAGTTVKCGIVKEFNNKKVSSFQLYFANETSWEKQCIPAYEFFKGEYPKEENEIVLSVKKLEDMGIDNPRIGMDIDVKYYPLAEDVEEEKITDYNFKISGYFKDYTGNSKSYVSKEFYNKTGAKQTDFTQGMLNISLENSLYSKDDIIEFKDKIDMKDKQFIASNEDIISEFIKITFVLIGLLIMIFISGYLFIYNTLNISINRNIRYFGQLKTIGTTSKQIKRIIYFQSFINSMVGICIGLFLGVLSSNFLIPRLIKRSMYIAVNDNISKFNLIIYMVAIVFSAITVFVGSIKPAKIAAEISPIDAMKYSQSGVLSSKIKSFPIRNLLRNKKQFFIILFSFIISITIFIIVNVIISGNDTKRILNEIYNYDIQILNETVLEENKNLITKEKISQLEKVKGIKNIRVVTSEEIKSPYQEDILGEFYKDLYKSRYSPGNYYDDISLYKNDESKINGIDNAFGSRLIGIDKNEYSRITSNMNKKFKEKDFIDGKIAFFTEKFVIPKSAVGKEFKFSPITEKVDDKYSIKIVDLYDKEDIVYVAGNYNPNIIISQNYFNEIVEKPIVELVKVEYEEPYNNTVEKEVENIFIGENNISFDSKLDAYNNMKDNGNKIKILGYSIALIIALLSILNYINVMASNIENRLNEFAVMESIGMTRRQIFRNLIKEGLIFGIASIVFSIIIGLPLSQIVFKSINEYPSLKYHLPILSNTILFVLIILICVFVPPLVFKISQKKSIIEQLKILNI